MILVTSIYLNSEKVEDIKTSVKNSMLFENQVYTNLKIQALYLDKMK